LKIKNPKTYPFYKDRPPCPHCGAYHSMSMGINKFKCGECGKCYMKSTLQINNTSKNPLVVHHI
jgi:ribosomal protein S27AE